MGRKRSNHICERCGEIGFKRTNPDAIVHYDPKTGKRRTCYYKNYLKKAPPNKFWATSPLYDKVGNIITHLENIADKLKKIQNTIFQYPPNEQTASRCVGQLDMFDKHLLIPMEKLLTPYVDERWKANWTKWFKIQMYSFEHGLRAASMKNLMPTGEYFMKLGKDEKSVVEYMVGNELNFKHIKGKEKQVLGMAINVLRENQLEKALDYWSNNTVFEEITGDPYDFYNTEMAKKNKVKTKSKTVN